MNAPRFDGPPRAGRPALTDRRQDNREEVRRDIVVTSGDARLPGVLRNISSSGALVWIAPDAVDPGRAAIDTIQLEGHPALHVTTRWGVFAGLTGVEFDDPKAAASTVAAILGAGTRATWRDETRRDETRRDETGRDETGHDDSGR